MRAVSKSLLAYLNRVKTPLYQEIIYCEGMVNNVSVEVAMQHNDSYSENTYGFVNNITTPEGGNTLSDSVMRSQRHLMTMQERISFSENEPNLKR